MLNFKPNYAFMLVIVVFVLTMSSCANNKSRFSVDEDRSLESHVTLALKYLEIKNRESARHHLSRAFDIDKRSIRANFAMAMLYQLEGEPELSEEFFKKTLRLNKSYTPANNNYGVYLFSRERYEEAYEYFEVASEDLEYVRRSEALMNLGRAALELNRNERAQAAFTHADLLNPNMALLKVELADFNFKKQDFSAAKFYLDAFEKISRPTARALLLGIKIERIFKNKDKEASYALALKNLFPYSDEALTYSQMSTKP